MGVDRCPRGFGAGAFDPAPQAGDAMPNSAVRRVVFTVVDPRPNPAATQRPVRPRPRNRGRRDRPDAVAQLPAIGRRAFAGGRAWAVCLGGSAGGPDRAVAPRRLRGWIMRTGAEAAKLDAGQTLGPGLVGHGAEGCASGAASSSDAQGQGG